MLAKLFAQQFVEILSDKWAEDGVKLQSWLLRLGLARGVTLWRGGIFLKLPRSSLFVIRTSATLLSANSLTKKPYEIRHRRGLVAIEPEDRHHHQDDQSQQQRERHCARTLRRRLLRSRPTWHGLLIHFESRLFLSLSIYGSQPDQSRRENLQTSSDAGRPALLNTGSHPR